MAIENGVQNAELGYILDPAFQIENLNGKPVVGGYICIYEAGTDNKYISYENFDGAQNPFKIPLKADGRAVILGDPSLTYDVYAYDSYGNQLFSRLNVQCNVPGNISIKGADTRIKNTDGTLDISLQTMSNNVREYTVNTRNKILDVQSPLYFVENSQSATVIGFSGDGFAKEDKFDYDENYNITGYDGSAFARTTYSAGDYVDITDDTISVTGLQPSGNYASASDVAAVEEKLDDKLDTSAFNVSAVIVNNFQYEGDKITAYNNSAFAGADYEAGQYVDITDDRISVTGVQPAGNYASASDVTELNDKLANKLDTTAAFTKSSADTLYQPIGDYATHDDLTAYATTSLVSSVSSTITGMIPTSDYELVAGSGVELVDDPTEHTKTINVTAEGTPVTAIEQMIESATSGLQPSGDYATTADLTAKQDTLDYGYHDAAISSIDTSALYDTSAHARINTLAGRISNLSSDKLDASAFSEVSGDFYTTANPSGFITDEALTPYQTIEGMTAYQEAGDYYSASNPSGFINEIPDTYLQNTDLEISDNKITGISGVPLAAGGGGVPEGVMAESGLEFNTDNEISGYNGSAFAVGGIPADAYTLSAGSGVEITDDQVNKVTTIAVTSQAGNPDVEAYVQNTSADIDATIINVSSNSGVWGGSALPVSAGPGVKIELTNNTLVFSNDETVLWEGTHDSFNTAINLSEAVSNFERIRILFGNAENKYLLWQDIELMSASDGYFFDVVKGAGTSNFWIQGLYCSGNDTQIVPVSGKRMNFGSFTASTNITSIPVNTTYPDALMFRKIVGIHRIAGGN